MPNTRIRGRRGQPPRPSTKRSQSPKSSTVTPPVTFVTRPFQPMRDAERVGRYHTELMLKQTELWRRLSSLPFDAQEARKDVQGRQESANWLRQLSTMMNRGEGMVLLLDTAEGEPVGYAFVTESFDPMTFDRMGIIGEIFVEEPWRGRGAGTEAIRAAERWLTERRVSTTQIFVTRTNEDAVKLYQQNGYITYDYRMVKRLFP